MKILFKLVFLLAVSIVRAQDCSNYYYLQNNKTVETSLFDKKGDITGKVLYSIADVKNSNGITTATLQSHMFDKKGKTIGKANSIVKCNGGVMMINMKLMMSTPQAEQFSQASAKTDDFFIEYPANMKKGDQLREGTLNMDVDNNGLQQSISMTVFDRKVEDKEKVTTPAGTWDCYKISYKIKMSIRVMGVGVPINMEGTEWYAPGFGVVKTSSKHGSTEITSIK
ncbi:MAG TPA: hypothetical protein VKA49_21355 [Flavitalea sp.]|nr:hypothetical protein [Flavitalea sp.]